MTGNRGRMRIEGGGVAVLCSFLGRFLSCGREPVDFTRQKGWALISTWPRLCPPAPPPLLDHSDLSLLDQTCLPAWRQVSERNNSNNFWKLRMRFNANFYLFFKACHFKLDGRSDKWNNLILNLIFASKHVEARGEEKNPNRFDKNSLFLKKLENWKKYSLE